MSGAPSLFHDRSAMQRTQNKWRTEKISVQQRDQRHVPECQRRRKELHISKQGQPDMHSHCLCVYFLPTSFLSFISSRRWKSAQREKRRERGDEGSVFPNLREVAGHKVHTKFIYLNTKIDQTKRKKVELFQLLIGILPFLSSLASSFSQKTPCVTMLKSFALAKVLKNIYTAFHLSTLMWLRAACSVL